MVRKLTCMIALAVSTHALAGPLTPPGAPTPTMKTLDEVEPRIIINDVNTPTDGGYQHVISQPGSYYLTENLVPTAYSAGIRVESDNVVIDLGGFTIDGSGNAGITAIELATNANVTIRNGTIVNWTSSGVFAFVTDNCVLEDLRFVNIGGTIELDDFARVSRCQFDAPLLVGDDALIERCSSNGGRIKAGARASIVDCAVFGAPGWGFETGESSTLTRCRATQSSDAGFSVGDGSTLDSCVADNNYEGFVSSGGVQFVNCRADSNTENGFYTAAGSQLTDCSATSNGMTGFKVSGSVFRGCFAELNLRGYEGGTDSVFESCVATNSLGEGFVVGSNTMLVQCNASGNASFGIIVGNESSIVDSVASSNGGAGVIGFSGDRVLVRATQAVANTGLGIDLGNRASVIDCLASENHGGGIKVGSNSIVRGCDASLNASVVGDGFGIKVLGDKSRVESNASNDNDGWGFVLEGANNFVVKNNTSSNGIGAFISIGGPNIVPTEVIGLSNSAWANISH